LNSSERILEFLQREYIAPQIKDQIMGASHIEISTSTDDDQKDEPSTKIIEKYKTNLGELEVEHSPNYYPFIGDKAYINGKPSPDGIYKLGFMWYVHIKHGKVAKTSFFGIPG